MKTLVCFGECMMEDHADGLFRFGGDTLNTALYLTRLTMPNQLTVGYATALGSDHDSSLLIAQWKKEGIDTRYVTQIVDRMPGRYRIKTDRFGERSFVYQRDDSAARYYLGAYPGAFEQFLKYPVDSYFYFSGISLAITNEQDRASLFSALERFKSHGGKVIFDNNFRPLLWKGKDYLTAYKQAMSLADIAFLTDEDEFSIYNDSSFQGIIERALQYGTRETIIKQGAQACVVFDGDNCFEVPTVLLKAEQIVDTCAAGDAFAAGYLSKRLFGESIEVSAQQGHQLAARVIQFPGAIIDRQSMSDLMPNFN